jgi:hypothetical protein
MRTTFFTYLCVLLLSLFALTAALPAEPIHAPVARDEVTADFKDVLARGEHTSVQLARADNSTSGNGGDQRCHDCGEWEGCCPPG